jgi:hypothetical protein
MIMILELASSLKKDSLSRIKFITIKKYPINIRMKLRNLAILIIFNFFINSS